MNETGLLVAEEWTGDLASDGACWMRLCEEGSDEDWAWVVSEVVVYLFIVLNEVDGILSAIDLERDSEAIEDDSFRLVQRRLERLTDDEHGEDGAVQVGHAGGESDDTSLAIKALNEGRRKLDLRSVLVELAHAGAVWHTLDELWVDDQRVLRVAEGVGCCSDIVTESNLVE